MEENARKAGIVRAYNVACEIEQFQWVLDNSNSFYGVCIGLQPTSVSSDNLRTLRETLDSNIGMISALGEVGLDYHWVREEEQRQNQRDAFETIIQMASQLGLPLVIHSRKAEQHCVDMLARHAETPVLMHSFEGNIKLLNEVSDHGWLVSIPTAVVRRRTFRRSAKNTPLDHLVLETDSPFLSPIEDKQNEPAHVRISAEYLATELLGTTLEDLAETTTRNARSFFLN